jgi:hypothetical protein
MFYGLHARAIPFEARRQSRIAHCVSIGLDVHDRIQIHTPENDAAVRRRRAQCQIDLLSGMQAYSGGTNDILQRALFDHVMRSGSASN